MKKSKTSQPRDRLSELADSLIFEIFWFLPMSDVAQTTILSKRWKNLWTTTPYLNFSFEKYGKFYEAGFPSFVNLALLSWRGSKIQKLKIDPPCWSPVYQHFEVWMRLAVSKNVQELYVHSTLDTAPEPYMMPQCIYSCSSLKLLSIEGRDLTIKSNAKWNQKSLRIKRVFTEGCEQLIQKFLCGSPQLEVLFWALWAKEANLSTRSISLKNLSIDNYVEDGTLSDNSYHVVLKIWSPKLETLEISGLAFSKCLLLDGLTLTLTNATLGYLYHCFDDILPAIGHVLRLTLSDHCLKVREDIDPQPFFNVKFLKINAFCVQHKLIVGVLEMFPKLNRLVLENENETGRIDCRDPPMIDAESFLEFEANIPKSFLRQLRTFEITWNEYDNSMFPFVEFVMKYARKLEKMVMRVIPVEGIMPSKDSLAVASLKLLNVPCSSSNCRVSFLY